MTDFIRCQLLFFKYFNFLSNTMVNICRIFSLQIHPITLSILVPVGISFYTFQAMSYVIDVYRAGGDGAALWSVCDLYFCSLLQDL